MRNPPLLFYFAKGYVGTSYGGQGFSTRRARKNLRALKKSKIFSPEPASTYKLGLQNF
jgi:hypothetical protein